MRSFKLALFALLALTSAAVAGYLPLLHAGMGVGVPAVPSFVLQTDGASYILLVDGVSKLQKAQP
jgi:hypothetical protein